MQYDRNDMDFHRGTFRVRGDVVEIIPAYESDTAIRVEFFGDEIDRITEIDVLTGEIRRRTESYSHLSGISLCCADGTYPRGLRRHIEEELEERVAYFKSEDKLLEAQRISGTDQF